jgi:hypothetical protein
VIQGAFELAVRRVMVTGNTAWKTSNREAKADANVRARDVVVRRAGRPSRARMSVLPDAAGAFSWAIARRALMSRMTRARRPSVLTRP